jgi:hypothetical protein
LAEDLIGIPFLYYKSNRFALGFIYHDSHLEDQLEFRLPDTAPKEKVRLIFINPNNSMKY